MIRWALRRGIDKPVSANVAARTAGTPRPRCRTSPRVSNRTVGACWVSRTACLGRWLMPRTRVQETYVRWHRADRRNVEEHEVKGRTRSRHRSLHEKPLMQPPVK